MAHTLIGTLLDTAAKALEGRPIGVSKVTLINALKSTAMQYEVTRNVSNARGMDRSDTPTDVLHELISSSFDAGVDWFSDGADDEPAQIALLRVQNDLGTEFLQRLRLALGTQT